MPRRRTCRWCPGSVAIRERIVLVGPLPGRPTKLLIDVAPHEGGEVVKRDDGKYRLLSPEQRRSPVKPVYRIHGERFCCPEAAR